MYRTYKVAGLRVIDASVDDGVRLIWKDVESGLHHVYALVNAFSATLKRDAVEYRSLLESDQTVCLPDGAPLAWGARLLAGASLHRCPGPDLFEAACAKAAEDGTRIYLLGGAEGVASTLADVLISRHPGLVVAGAATPPFGEWTDSQSQSLIDEVAASGASVLWLGVSAPKQEIWATRYATELRMPIVCVGAAFDFLSGTKSRAPRWMRDVGLEWLFRLITEPRRLWKRYLIGNVIFLWDLMRLRACEIPSLAEDGTS